MVQLLLNGIILLLVIRLRLEFHMAKDLIEDISLETTNAIHIHIRLSEHLHMKEIMLISGMNFLLDSLDSMLRHVLYSQ